jgi:hypothetical protein
VTKSISSMNDLEKRLQELERLHDAQMADLKLSAVGVVQSFSPSNMLKTVLHDMAHSPDLRKAAINTVIGMGAGFISRKLYVGKSGNIFKKFTGPVVQFLITNFVRKRISGEEVKEDTEDIHQKF